MNLRPGEIPAVRPLLSVVIVTWNSEADLPGCLASVEAAAQGISAEIIVVDNHSADGTREVAQGHRSPVRILDLGTNAGFARANNEGIRAARGEFVLLLNPDTIVRADAFRNAIAHMRTDPRVGALGARLLTPDGSVQVPCITTIPTVWDEACSELGLIRLFPKSPLFDRHRMLYHDFDRSTEVGSIGGAFMFLRRTALAETGLLDESLFLYGEEEDLCRRMAKRGQRVLYAADVIVTHLGGRSTTRTEAGHPGAAEAWSEHYWRSRDHVLRKHGSIPVVIGVRALRVVGMGRRLLTAWRLFLTGRSSWSRSMHLSRQLTRALLIQITPPKEVRQARNASTEHAPAGTGR